MIRNIIIGLSIIFFTLSGIITIKASRIPDKHTNYQSTQKELISQKILPNSKDKLGRISKEQADDQALIKELQAKIALLEKKLSDKNMKTQANIVSESEEHNVSGKINAQGVKNQSKELFLYSLPDDKDKLNQKINVDSQHASRIIYTIQIGSHTKKTVAEEEFISMLRTLNKKEGDYLRIEKIGKYFTVRLGKFDNYDNTEKVLATIKPSLSTAVILKAYIKNERIIKLYRTKEKQLTFQREF